MSRPANNSPGQLCNFCQKRFFGFYRRSLREDAVKGGRILGCERAYARSHPKIRVSTTEIPKEHQNFALGCRTWDVILEIQYSHYENRIPNHPHRSMGYSRDCNFALKSGAYPSLTIGSGSHRCSYRTDNDNDHCYSRSSLGGRLNGWDYVDGCSDRADCNHPHAAQAKGLVERKREKIICPSTNRGASFLFVYWVER